jgi:trigger factor
LSEIGAANGIDVSDQEMRNLVAQAASQYQGKDRERFLQLIQQEPMFAAQLRAPLYEDKVVDFLFGKSDITDRKADREQLEADLESEEGHVHGPGCGHDHGAAPEKAKGKKADAKKAVAKERAEPKEPGPTKSKAGAKKADVSQKVDVIQKAGVAQKADVAQKAQEPSVAKPKKGEPAVKAAKKSAAKATSKTEGKSAPKPKKPAKKA